jgi:hypothetical protein
MVHLMSKPQKLFSVLQNVLLCPPLYHSFGRFICALVCLLNDCLPYYFRFYFSNNINELYYFPSVTHVNTSHCLHYRHRSSIRCKPPPLVLTISSLVCQLIFSAMALPCSCSYQMVGTVCLK